MSVRARAAIPDESGRLLLDRTHHAGKDAFYWLPGGGVEPGETATEALRRELVEEASLEVEPVRLLYLSENLFVESGDYRHEVILYFLARPGRTLPGAPVDLREHEWHRPGETPGPLLPAAVARELAFDVRDGFRRPVLHLVTDERPA